MPLSPAHTPRYATQTELLLLGAPIVGPLEAPLRKKADVYKSRNSDRNERRTGEGGEQWAGGDQRTEVNSGSSTSARERTEAF